MWSSPAAGWCGEAETSATGHVQSPSNQIIRASLATLAQHVAETHAGILASLRLETRPRRLQRLETPPPADDNDASGVTNEDEAPPT